MKLKMHLVTLFLILAALCVCGSALCECDHDWSEWEEIQPLSCTTDRIMKRACSLCGTEEKETTVACPGGHDYQLASRQDATCQEEGYEIWRCQNILDGSPCDAPEERKTLLMKPHEHNLNAWQTLSAPSCERDGEKVNYCTLCHQDAIYDAIPALGHLFTGSKPLYGGSYSQEASCTAPGFHSEQCERDGCSETRIVTDAALGHQWGQWTENSSAYPDCTHDLERSRKCARCGEEERETVARATGHTPETRVVREAAVGVAGEAQEVCASCGIVLRDGIEIPALGEAADRQWEAGMRHDNVVSSLGPCTRDLVGGDAWDRVTPVDFSLEGVFEYPLIASNVYGVGQMTITIRDGEAVVTYALSGKSVTVKSESLTIYSSLAALRQGQGQVFHLNESIPWRQAFGEDARLIIALRLIADYNTQDAGISPFKFNPARISEMMELMD